MLKLFRRNPHSMIIQALYGAIVAQARTHAFYKTYGVPDTVNGRLNLLMLHLALVFDRLSHGSESPRETGQALFERFCLDMDDHLREQGVSDLKVPAEVRGLAAAFFGRLRAYISAVRSADAEALQDALRRNVFDNACRSDAAPLAGYVRAAMVELEKQAPSDIAAGRLRWPDAATEFSKSLEL